MRSKRTKARTLSVSRRDFVKASAAVGAAAAVSPAALARAAWAGGSDTVRVGLIGCGGRGSGAALQALRADEATTLWAMGDAFEERIEGSLNGIQNGIRESHPALANRKIQVDGDRRFSGFDAFRGVIENSDVVILTTPPAFRPQHLRAAVEARRHVFCEKPVAVDGPGIRSVLESAEIARRNGTCLMSGFCWRYHAQCRELFGALHEGRAGDILAVHTTYNTTGWHTPQPRRPEWSEMEWRLRNWHYAHWLSGDHIVEQAVHAIDWINWIFKGAAPTRCTAVGGRMTRPEVPETGDVYDNFAVTYEFEGGARGTHMCRHWPNTPSDNTMYALGTRGRSHMNPWAGRPHGIDGDAPWRGEASANDMYQQEHDELFAGIRAGERINDGVFMAHSSMMAIMGRMAAYTGQVVTWEQALNSSESLTPATWEWGDAPPCELAIPGRPRNS
ncbi:MAG: Gfo/Idh/MocA family oxidoreductase [Phycisphaeraceae bacterium]|nr:Gfo/Idh/MocA family oxidoreductase [Phycisphaeraceae bacterium]